MNENIKLLYIGRTKSHEHIYCALKQIQI